MERFDWGLLIPLGGMVMTGWVFYAFVDAFRQWYKQRVIGQFQAKLLDRITTINELGAFLNTEAGARFMESMTSEAAGPHMRILRATQSGVVLTVLGLALFIWNWLSPTTSGEAASAVYGMATIVLALGIGFLLSATLSYRLSKEMGLLDANHRHVSDQPLPTV
jgi:predicted phage tail protein